MGESSVGRDRGSLEGRPVSSVVAGPGCEVEAQSRRAESEGVGVEVTPGESVDIRGRAVAGRLGGTGRVEVVGRVVWGRRCRVVRLRWCLRGGWVGVPEGRRRVEGV